MHATKPASPSPELEDSWLSRPVVDPISPVIRELGDSWFDLPIIRMPSKPKPTVPNDDPIGLDDPWFV